MNEIMIQVPELRVGNKLKIDGVVVTINERTIFDFNQDKRVKEPILLTTEFLKNHTEFERYTGWDDQVYWAIKSENNNNKRFELLELDNGFELPSGYVCEFVHQLQNCFFFHYCDGRELKIN